MNEKEIQFPFLLVWKNNNFKYLYNYIKNENNDKNEIIEYIFNELVNEIQVFMNNKVYIRFNNKPIFAIENSLMFNKKKMLLLRKTFKNKGVGNIHQNMSFLKIVELNSIFLIILE